MTTDNMPQAAFLQQAIDDMQQMLDALKQESEMRYLDVIELRRRASALRYQVQAQAEWMRTELNKQAANKQITKWDLMSDRERQIMDLTPFTANGTGRCSACYEYIPTEGAFARHFLLIDVSYPNVSGYCRNKHA